MKVLVFANANSVWIYNLFSLFVGSDIEMTLWSPYRVDKYYRDLYSELGIRIIDSPEYVYEYLEGSNHTLISKLRFLFNLIGTIIRVSAKCRWDIVNVHYVDPHLLRVFAFFPSITKRLVLSYWGSDLMRENRSTLIKVRSIVSGCLGCTFENDNLKQVHEGVYKDSPERTVIMLPLPILGDIDREFGIRNSNNVDVDGNTIDRERISICICYNGRRQQQHDKVLEQLEKLDDSVKEKILLLFPFTYSVDKNDTYIDDLKIRIIESGIESLVFERMLSNTELARLRLATDIFINAQTTDSFSGSVCEVLYAGGRLVNPKWLHYTELDTYDLEYEEYSDFNELPSLIETMVNSFDRNDMSVHNREVMKLLRSMEQCETNWKAYFREVVEK